MTAQIWRGNADKQIKTKKIIKLLERISKQLSTISEGVAYVVSREKARDQQQHEEVKKLLEQSRIGHPLGKNDVGQRK